MEKKITRRTFLKKGILSLLTLASIGAGGKYYIHNIEPNWLEINHVPIRHDLIPNGFQGLTILQFSDTHLGFQFQLKDLQKLVDTINSHNADIVIFTGDLIDDPTHYPHSEEIIAILSQIKAPIGKYSIYGNHDHGGYGSELYKSIMDQSNFTMLQNANDFITLHSGEKMAIAGIDDAMLGEPNIKAAVAAIPDDMFTILLSHAPDLAKEAQDYPIQFQISGHSHGGQVQIPFFGALVTPPYAEEYIEGLYELESLELYVNRGIGTTRLPYRFLSRPELTIYTLQPTQN